MILGQDVMWTVTMGIVFTYDGEQWDRGDRPAHGVRSVGIRRESLGTSAGTTGHVVLVQRVRSKPSHSAGLQSLRVLGKL